MNNVMNAAWAQQASQLLSDGTISTEEFFVLAMTDEEGGAERLQILVCLRLEIAFRMMN